MARSSTGRGRTEIRNRDVLEEYSSRVRDADRGNSTRNDSYRDRSRSRSRSFSPYIPMSMDTRFCHPRTFGINDVELVIVTTRSDKFEEYAESILRRLYQRSIAANVLYLADNAPLDAAVHEFGRCGTHYVVIVMPRHPKTKAISVRVFEGTDRPTQEHRNMNVDEGVEWISHHYNLHYPGLARLRKAEVLGSAFYPPASPEVARTLKRTAESSAVPTSSLDAAIAYLHNLRERTAAYEGLDEPALSQDTAMPAASYQGRGLEINSAVGQPYGGMQGRASLLSHPDKESIHQPYGRTDGRSRQPVNAYPENTAVDNRTAAPYGGMDSRTSRLSNVELDTMRSPYEDRLRLPVSSHATSSTYTHRPYNGSEPSSDSLPTSSQSSAALFRNNFTGLSAIRHSSQPFEAGEDRARLPIPAQSENSHKPYNGAENQLRPSAATSEAEALRQVLLGILSVADGLSGTPTAPAPPVARKPELPAFTSYPPPQSGPARPPASAAFTEENVAALAANPAALQKLLTSLGAMTSSQAHESPCESAAPEVHPYQAQFGGMAGFRGQPSQRAPGETRDFKRKSDGGSTRFSARQDVTDLATVPRPPGNGISLPAPRAAMQGTVAPNFTQKPPSEKLTAHLSQNPGGWLAQLSASVNRVQNSSGTQ